MHGEREARIQEDYDSRTDGRKVGHYGKLRCRSVSTAGFIVLLVADFLAYRSLACSWLILGVRLWLCPVSNV